MFTKSCKKLSAKTFQYKIVRIYGGVYIIIDHGYEDGRLAASQSRENFNNNLEKLFWRESILNKRKEWKGSISFCIDFLNQDVCNLFWSKHVVGQYQLWSILISGAITNCHKEAQYWLWPMPILIWLSHGLAVVAIAIIVNIRVIFKKSSVSL